MTEFRFRSKLLTLYIEGHIFEIEMTNEFLQKMNEYSALCGEKAEQLRSSSVKQDGVAEAILSEIIDKLLGEGAVDQIFCERKRDIFDLCDIIIYICDECERFQSKKINRYRELLEKEAEADMQRGKADRIAARKGGLYEGR